MKLKEVYEKYMYDASLQKRRTTIDSYDYRFKRVLEFYDDCEISEITYDSAIAFQHELYENKGFSAKYTNHVVSVLNQVVSFAYAKGYISHFPLAGLKGIKSTKVVEKEYYDLKTFQEFVSFVDDETDHLMFDILFFLGLRKGELLALRWKNIDLVNGIVTIDSSMKKIKGKGLVLSEPKTKNSYRKIVCNKSLTEELNAVFMEVKARTPKTNNLYLFGGVKPIAFSTLDKRLSHYLDLAGTPKITLHGFRHSHSTMLNELSPDIKAIADRLGHDDVTTTLKVYIHSNVHSQENLAKLIENEIQKDKQFDDFNLYVEQILKMLIGGLTSDKFTPEEILKITTIYQQVLTLK